MKNIANYFPLIIIFLLIMSSLHYHSFVKDDLLIINSDEKTTNLLFESIGGCSKGICDLKFQSEDGSIYTVSDLHLTNPNKGKVVNLFIKNPKCEAKFKVLSLKNNKKITCLSEFRNGEVVLYSDQRSNKVGDTFDSLKCY